MGYIFSVGSGVADSIFGICEAPIRSILDSRGEAYEKKSMLGEFFSMETSDNAMDAFTGTTGMNGFLPVGENGVAVRPAMVWSDKRCAAQKEAYLREVGDADTMYRKTGWKLGNGLNANQIRWMRDNEPENFARTKLFLSVPDYISLKMTGVAACDMSDAGINQLANIREFAYDPQLLAFAGVTEEQLPKLVRSGEVIGHLTEQAAAELGLTTDCVLVAGAHDQYAVALGADIVNM